MVPSIAHGFTCSLGINNLSIGMTPLPPLCLVSPSNDFPKTAGSLSCHPLCPPPRILPVTLPPVSRPWEPAASLCSFHAMSPPDRMRCLPSSLLSRSHLKGTCHHSMLLLEMLGPSLPSLEKNSSSWSNSQPLSDVLQATGPCCSCHHDTLRLA